MKTQFRSIRTKGFALVITLSLMILLTVVAVGLLTLSTISLRTSSQGEAMATAQNNARLALMLAIGNLQKTMGPDRAVSANSEVLSATPQKKHLTGAWESWWDFDPSKASNYTSEKQKRFRRWLVSNADPEATEAQEFATSAWTGQTIELIGNNSLGGKADPNAKVVAGKVPVARNGKIQGAYAWHVADESAKARINIYRDPSQNSTIAEIRALAAGHRPDPSVMQSSTGTPLDCMPTDLTTADFNTAKEQSGKLTDLAQVDLLDKAKGKIQPLRHDVTPYSLGVLSDVRGGGLKQDLSSVFELNTNLPSEFSGNKLYASTHGITGPSDPYWSTLSGYYNIFRNITDLEGSPKLEANFPAAASTNNNSTQGHTPTGYYPVPVIAKVETIFSLVGRPVSDVSWFDHVPGANGFLDKYDYFVDLIFTPLVTLHNPYNVNISFYKMQVDFRNVPVAFNFKLNGVSQSVEPNKFESLNTMALADLGAGKTARGEKVFGITIANWRDAAPSSTAISGPIIMKPGQTLICGPSIDESKSFKTDAAAGNNTTAFDWRNELTQSMHAKPSFNPGLGFETCGITIEHNRSTSAQYTQQAYLFLKGADTFSVDFKAQKPSWYKDNTTLNKQEVQDASFEVKAQIQTTASGTLVDYTHLRFDYNDNTTLENFFDNQVHSYPPTGSKTGPAIAAQAGVPYGSQSTYVEPFAIFSAYARTTNGGVDETGKRSKGNLLDGRLAGKPFVFHNPSRAVVAMNLASDTPGTQSYELNLQPYEGTMDVDINRVPALTGNTTARGIKSGSYLELPTGPMQTIADFRRSNALTSSYLPNFTQPVGNSLLHPMMSASSVKETYSAASPSYDLLDHSVLANHALYDRFYFSTFATRGKETPDAVFEAFMKGSTPLPAQGFQPYLPEGKSESDAKAELFSGSKPKDGAYKTAAEYQMTKAPFNVNSTSVQAWKAVLASMNKSEIATLWAKNATKETKKTSGVPILGMSMLNGGKVGGAIDADKIDDTKTNEWNGFRELDNNELESLADKIVEQVRDRGPFLSMSEFVNRQVGSQSELTLRGALESAINKSDINKNFMKGNVTEIAASDVSDNKIYNYKTPEATTGNPAAGAPGYISQGDLMRILEPGATVHGDTFVIRVCGEAWDPNGKVTARAYAEAVVQRMPEYVDPVDRPSLNAHTDTTAAKANKIFGRRINLVSFRWLSSNEI